MSDIQNLEMGKCCKISQWRPIVRRKPIILGKHTDHPYPTSGETPLTTVSALQNNEQTN